MHTQLPEISFFESLSIKPHALVKERIQQTVPKKVPSVSCDIDSPWQNITEGKSSLMATN